MIDKLIGKVGLVQCVGKSLYESGTTCGFYMKYASGGNFEDKNKMPEGITHRDG